MAIRLPSYLHRNRCGIYGFRIVIPLDVRVFFKSKEYRVTLCLTDIPALGEGSLVEMYDFHVGLRTGWWESMKALFRARAKRYVAPIYSPQFLRRLMPLFSAKKRRWRSSGMRRANCAINWRSSENRATLGVNGCQFGIESHHCFPIGKYTADSCPSHTKHSRSGNITCT